MLKKLFRKKTVAREPATVDAVDVARYCGTWYEIASYQPKEQRRCRRTKAEYTLNPEGYVDVRNSCQAKGRERSVRAKAFPVPDSGNAKLKVQFFRFFKGDYWVVDLADDYSWAAVSGPTSRNLWILSRTPYMTDELYRSLAERLAEKGFDTARLVKTDQQ
ncbi:lipocalin family protein [Prosthecochloris sp. N3]|uniref:Lipocalin family protein n=1 Tax=Prosthecochloris ethylica TaxID=2743976 RepID=A0ABR9XPN7_9CHLB|nr:MULTISPECIES: lipocalin family protein [Prosthecochloris]MEC9487400.1 lipocalin family protein [Prosthecochloris sp.]MBF0586238.1 lipocalin family protein [Prosthecochloris ethylica]MBF0635944.1 lipocalin family protein [Prosthecochloris ethylica]NUK47381.1 lipocalin family protein [Prosthecochloris ethylica]RNA64936.1 lipocalin [Prosthecochloris sp. ZM_2]